MYISVVVSCLLASFLEGVASSGEALVSLAVAQFVVFHSLVISFVLCVFIIALRELFVKSYFAVFCNFFLAPPAVCPTRGPDACAR